ncbi:MAG TPA: transporter substrate-binding domain-containing protein [Xanthobacteraceae bacterium]|nr:transporter substrate-binding domain-containing protein [Xanthobacteraceae bacterium]
MRLLPMVAALTGTALIFAGLCRAQTPENPGASPQVELVIGTKDAPPFAMKAADGSWQGISIDLWRHVADELHLHYRFAEEPNVQGLIDGVAAGKFDVAAAALTVTAGRVRILDFTQPFYATGLGIAVPVGGEASWLPIIRTLTSFGFAQAILALVGLALAVGFLVWFFERHHNEDFGGGVTKGLSSGVWWSTVAMTQRVTGNFGPRTLPGRIVAIVWMVGSIVTIAVFTASIMSVLTIKHLQGTVHGVSDLSTVRVGALTGTSTEETLFHLRITYQKFATLPDGLNALRKHEIDAFVYDKPLLAWAIHQGFSSSIELVDATFEPQEYAFALPRNSPLRKALDVAILDAIHSAWWEQTIFRYFGVR